RSEYGRHRVAARCGAQPTIRSEARIGRAPDGRGDVEPLGWAWSSVATGGSADELARHHDHSCGCSGCHLTGARPQYVHLGIRDNGARYDGLGNDGGLWAPDCLSGAARDCAAGPGDRAARIVRAEPAEVLEPAAARGGVARGEEWGVQATVQVVEAMVIPPGPCGLGAWGW